MDTIKKLKQLVKKHGAASLASEMGFKCSETILYWIRSGEIPFHKQEYVLKFITQKEGTKNVITSSKSGSKKKR